MNNVSQQNVREQVVFVLREMLTDPDYGKELLPDFVKKLQASVTARKNGKIVSFDDVLRRYRS